MSDVLTGLARDANAALHGVGRTVGAGLGGLFAAEADAGDAFAVDQHHVGDVDRSLRGDDAAGVAAALVDDLLVLLHTVDALDDDALVVDQDRADLALCALVARKSVV